jgi:acyl dehydratase
VTRRLRLEELPGLVGQELGVSGWFDVSQARIDAFAEVTEDRQWIHLDVERATREIGAPIAHGFLTLSMLSAMFYQLVEFEDVDRGVNYGFDRIRFLAPVPAGARIRSREVLLSVEPKAGGVAITRQVTVEIEGQDKPALVAEWIGVLYA